MPVVPRYESQINQAGIPAARVSTEAPNAAFGVGNDGPSKALTGLNNEMFAIVQKEKQKADDTATKGLQIKAVHLANDLMFNSENGAVTKQGKDAFGVIDDYTAQYDKKASEYLSELTPDQRAIGQMILDQHRGDLETDLHRHVRGESEKLEDETFKNLVETNRNDAVLHYTDMDRINQSLDTTRKAIESYADDNGKDKDWADSVMLQASSKTHSGVIEAMLAKGQTSLAKTYFKNNEEGFDADTKKDVTAKLKEGTLKADAQYMADKYISKSENMGEALDKIPKGTEVELRDEAEKRIMHHYSVKEAVDKQEKEELNKTFTELAAVSTDIDAIHRYPGYDKLEESDKKAVDNRIMSNINGDVPSSDRRTISYLDNLMKTNFSAFMKEDLNSPKFRFKLTDEDFKRYSKIKSEGKSGTSKELDGYLSDNQAVDRVLNKAGLKSDKDSPAITQRYDDVTLSVNREAKAQAQDKGRPLTTVELEQIAKKHTVEYILEQGWFSNTKKKYGEFTPDEQKALDWIKAYPNDPRVNAMKKKLGFEE